MASTFQSPQLAQPSLSQSRTTTTAPAPSDAMTPERQQYLEQQRQREAAQTTPSPAPAAVTRTVAPAQEVTPSPAIVEFTPYVETKTAAQAKQGSNLILWLVGGAVAYQLLKK